MDPSEYYTYEDRAYVSPTLSRDEQLGFVNTLRDTVNNDIARINAQTQRLGTDITPNLGGLTGSNGYFAQRYATMPVESQANILKSTAQAKALNDLMTNYQNQAANRYNQSYRNARAKAAASSGGSGSGSGDYLKDVLKALGYGDLEDENGGTGEGIKSNDTAYILGSDGKYYKKADLIGKYTRVRTNAKNMGINDKYHMYTPVMKDKYINSNGVAVYFPAGSIDKY